MTTRRFSADFTIGDRTAPTRTLSVSGTTLFDSITIEAVARASGQGTNEEPEKRVSLMCTRQEWRDFIAEVEDMLNGNPVRND